MKQPNKQANFNKQTVILMSGDDDYLMNETRRKPTTGTRSPTLFDTWHRIFYMLSRADTAGLNKTFHYPVAQTRLGIIKAFDYPVRDHCENCPGTRQILTPDLSVHEYANHQTTMTAPSRMIKYTPAPQRKGSSPFVGDRLR